MSPSIADVDAYCVDCRGAGMALPRLAQGKSPRCSEHHQDRERYLAQGRQARQRARAQGSAPSPPSSAAWAQAYSPRLLPEGQQRGALLTADDVSELAAIVSELRDALDDGNNAYRLEDPTAMRLALRDLLDRAYETVSVLEQVPGVRSKPTRGR